MNTKEILYRYLQKHEKEHRKLILNENTIKDAFIYCIVNGLSSLNYGMVCLCMKFKKMNFDTV
jgi:hypothetical protein